MLKKIKALIIKWRAILGLDWWNIDVSIEKTQPNSRATTEFAMGKYLASMKFDANYVKSDEDAEELVVHELLHLFLTPYREVLVDLMAYLPPEARKSFTIRFQRVDEQMVIKLSAVIYELRDRKEEKKEN